MSDEFRAGNLFRFIGVKEKKRKDKKTGKYIRTEQRFTEYVVGSGNRPREYMAERFNGMGITLKSSDNLGIARVLDCN